VRYYRDLFATAAADATGYDALLRVLGQKARLTFSGAGRRTCWR
jgi:hypothetical protein